MLARAHRVTSGDDYRAAVRRGARAGVPGVVVSALARTDPSSPTRFGFIVSKRVGVAVVRNRMRRRLKAISLELLDEMPTGYDIVFRMLPESAGFDFATLRERARAASASAVRRSRPRVTA